MNLGFNNKKNFENSYNSAPFYLGNLKNTSKSSSELTLSESAHVMSVYYSRNTYEVKVLGGSSKEIGKYGEVITIVPMEKNSVVSIESGEGATIDGNDVTIIATGICVDSAMQAAKILEEKGIKADVINIHTIKPLDEEMVIASAKKTGKVFTVEEHSVIGGLGSAVCDCLAANAPTKVVKIGMNDKFGESGPANALVEKYGLDGKGVAATILANI